MKERFKECDTCYFCKHKATWTYPDFTSDACLFFEKLEGTGRGMLNNVYTYSDRSGKYVKEHKGCACYVNRYSLFEKTFNEKIEELKKKY